MCNHAGKRSPSGSAVRPWGPQPAPPVLLMQSQHLQKTCTGRWGAGAQRGDAPLRSAGRDTHRAQRGSPHPSLGLLRKRGGPGHSRQRQEQVQRPRGWPFQIPLGAAGGGGEEREKEAIGDPAETCHIWGFVSWCLDDSHGEIRKSKAGEQQHPVLQLSRPLPLRGLKSISDLTWPRPNSAFLPKPVAPHPSPSQEKQHRLAPGL